MRLFLDSSSFAKRLVDEPGSGTVERLCSRATELGLSVICTPEVISALNRRRREGLLTAQHYAQAKRSLSSDVRDAVIIQLTPGVVQLTISLLESASLRAMDAIHVASAIAWGADVFASSDLRQLTAARAAGLKVEKT